MGKLLRDHENGESVDAVCLLCSVSENLTSQQKPYLRFEFGDSSGRLAGVMWEGFDEQVGKLAPGEVVRVQGQMEQYRDKPQIKVGSITRLAPGSYDPSELLPSTERDTGQMMEELDGIVRSLSTKPLRKLLGGMFGDTEFRRSFSAAPAAKRWHQPYVGGLLEHTLNVHSHAVGAASRYPEANLEIVSAGALVHDIGKVVEYRVENFFETTTRGRLLGHLVIGVEMLDEWINRQERFPEDLGWHLKHIILSHHGELAYGSPVVPRTLEALLIHLADNLDSKMSGVLRVLRREREKPGEWTSYIQLMEREFFKGGLTGGREKESGKTGSGEQGAGQREGARSAELPLFNDSPQAESRDAADPD